MVHFCSRKPTPELPLLESAASELAALDDLERLPAAAFDFDKPWEYETPATTLPASPHDDDSCSSVSDEHNSAEDYKQSRQLVPVWPNAPPRCERLCIKNTFVELDESEAPRARSRAASDFMGLRDLKAQGITEEVVACFRKARHNFCQWAEPYDQVHYVPMWVPVSYDQAMPFSGGLVEYGTSYEGDAPVQCWPVNAPPTTLMLSNLPVEMMQEDLLEILDREELSGKYDFVFFPGIDATARSRHALLNATDHEHGREIAGLLHGKSAWGVADAELGCEVTWYLPVQGLSDLIRVYRDAPENHPDVPEEFRPQLFSGGWPVAFPPSHSEMMYFPQ